MFATWVPPHGCRSTPAISSNRTFPTPRGGFTHRAHQVGLRVELLVGDPHGAHVVAARDQARQLALEVLAVERLDHVEIQPCVLRRDRAAVGLVRDDGAQQVGGGVEAHVAVAALPVDAHGDVFTHSRQLLAGRGHVKDGGAFALHRIGDRDLPPIRAHQNAGVTRLAAAARIEHAAVEDDSGLAGQHDSRLVLAPVWLFAIQRLGHAVYYAGVRYSNKIKHFLPGRPP